jgi:hypothetical protein
MPQKITLCATFPLFGHAPIAAKIRFVSLIFAAYKAD